MSIPTPPSSVSLPALPVRMSLAAKPNSSLALLLPTMRLLTLLPLPTWRPTLDQCQVLDVGGSVKLTSLMTLSTPLAIAACGQVSETISLYVDVGRCRCLSRPHVSAPSPPSIVSLPLKPLSCRCRPGRSSCSIAEIAKNFVGEIVPMTNRAAPPTMSTFSMFLKRSRRRSTLRVDFDSIDCLRRPARPARRRDCRSAAGRRPYHRSWCRRRVANQGVVADQAFDLVWPTLPMTCCRSCCRPHPRLPCRGSRYSRCSPMCSTMRRRKGVKICRCPAEDRLR